MKLPEGFHMRNTNYQNYFKDDIICPFSLLKKQKLVRDI